jgi:hypothetical protein
MNCSRCRRRLERPSAIAEQDSVGDGQVEVAVTIQIGCSNADRVSAPANVTWLLQRAGRSLRARVTGARRHDVR